MLNSLNMCTTPPRENLEDMTRKISWMTETNRGTSTDEIRHEIQSFGMFTRERGAKLQFVSTELKG
jgi:hypothetical protein